MSDIELVIKISEEEYNRIQSMDWKNGDRFYDESVRAIHNGITLPKGHGRLIDADLVSKQYGLDDATKYGNKNAQQQAFSYSTMMMYEIANMIDDAPTIIEADTESEDKE